MIIRTRAHNHIETGKRHDHPNRESRNYIVARTS